MDINVIYIGRIRSKIGQREEVIKAAPGSTVLSMLENLIQNHGKELQNIVFDRGELMGGLNVIVDGINVTSTVLSNDPDEIARLPKDYGEVTEVELVLLDAPPSGGTDNLV